MQVTITRDSTKIQYLCKKNKRLEKLISIIGPLSYELHEEKPFSFLVHEIIEQMLSIQTGATIFQRLENLVDGEITPERINKLTVEEIRSTGTSTAKAQYIKNLAFSELNKEIDLDELPSLSNEEALKTLTKL